MKRHTFFLTYTQNPCHVLHFEKVRKIFIKKWQLFENVNKFLLIWATLKNFCAKTSNFLWKKLHLFQTVNKSYLFWELWTTFARKLMKRPTIFMTYFHSSGQFFTSTKIFLKNGAGYNMLRKCYLFQQLWRIFWTKIMKNPTIFVTYFQSFFHFLHHHTIIMTTFLEQKWQLFQCC